MHKKITVFEHQSLRVGKQGFQQKHLNAVLKLNELHDWKYFNPIVNGIKFKEYVGIIQIDGLLIEIHPKSDKDDSDEKWQKVLLQMLQACGKLKATSAGTANVKRSNLNLLEVYFELFLTELQTLQRKGFSKQYRKQTQNTKALKGKLEFAGHIQRNSIHKERFYTTHQVYDTDHLVHQIIYKALTIVAQFTKGTWLYDFCKRMLINFPAVSNKSITTQQINSVKLGRKFKDYENTFELARLIILNYSPSISGGKEKMLSLLFDMNALWETFIVKQLQKASINTNIQVFKQETKPFWGNSYLQPDIILRKDNKVYIIDTKWKKPNNHKASIQDLRQMYTYCRFWKAEKAILLYPGESLNNAYKPYKTEDYITYDDIPQKIVHHCKMEFISVLNDKGELDLAIGEKIFKIL